MHTYDWQQARSNEDSAQSVTGESCLWVERDGEAESFLSLWWSVVWFWWSPCTFHPKAVYESPSPLLSPPLMSVLQSALKQDFPSRNSDIRRMVCGQSGCTTKCWAAGGGGALSGGPQRARPAAVTQQGISSQLSGSLESGLMAHPFPWVDLSLVSPKCTHKHCTEPVDTPFKRLRELALICKHRTGQRSPHKVLPSKTGVVNLLL